MERNELRELHYITPISNVPSIVEHGILSHVRASRLQHQSVAMQAIQDRRAPKSLPGGRPLHEYVNLYICARNPMLRKRKDRHLEICVLRVSPDVLDLPDAIVSDQNAASDYVRFSKAPEGLAIVNREMVFAEWWKYPENQILEWRHASVKGAEVLVPDQVDARFVLGAYVSCEKAKASLETLNTGLAVRIDPHLFFMRGTRL